MDCVMLIQVRYICLRYQAVENKLKTILMICIISRIVQNYSNTEYYMVKLGFQALCVGHIDTINPHMYN